MPKHAVARADEIPNGAKRIVTIANRSIGVFNVQGEFFALRNRCPHQGGPLCDGPVLGLVTSRVPGEYDYSPSKLVQCPWHGWEFDLRTGQSWFDPERTRVRPYPVQVRPGRELADENGGRVPGPYVAEVFPVSLEDEYVVVEVPD